MVNRKGKWFQKNTISRSMEILLYILYFLDFYLNVSLGSFSLNFVMGNRASKGEKGKKKRKRGKNAEIPSRVIWLNGGGEKNKGYPNNKIITAKYSWWNFIPKNLFEQFRRIANFYFLIICIIVSSIDGPVSPVTAVLPLVLVITITMIKQGIEDAKRHKNDREVNNKVVTVIRHKREVNIKSRDIQVGDLVIVHRDEDIPCDLVLLGSSDPDGKAFLTTANLDGETNLKTMNCPHMMRLFSTDQLSQLEARVECEPPTADLYNFYGKIQVFPGDNSGVYGSMLRREKAGRGRGLAEPPPVKRSSVAYGEVGEDGRRSLKRLGLVMGGESQSGGGGAGGPGGADSAGGVSADKSDKDKGDKGEKGDEDEDKGAGAVRLSRDSGPDGGVPVRRFSMGLSAPLDKDNLLLRCTTLRTTDRVYGCAVYTGQDTKMSLNSLLTHHKYSVIERSVNWFLVFFLGFLILEIIISMILKYHDESETGRGKSTYMGDYYDIKPKTIVVDILAFIIIYNYIIPISLYVTMELQKFMGALWFSHDLDIWDEEMRERAIYNTSDINEDMGQIEVLFTDKTGTLTENDMKFKRCAIGDMVFAEEDGDMWALNDDMDIKSATRVEELTPEMEEFFIIIALCNTVQLEQPHLIEGKPPERKALSKKELKELENVLEVENKKEDEEKEDRGKDKKKQGEESDDEDKKGKKGEEDEEKEEKEAEDEDAKAGKKDKKDKDRVKKSENEKEPGDKKNGRQQPGEQHAGKAGQSGVPEQQPPGPLGPDGPRYASTSPDEKALVEAAARNGIVLKEVKGDETILEIKGKERKFRKLEVLEFTSDRKRMSVVVEDDNGHILLLCKGSDTTVLPLCVDEANVRVRVSDFSKRGLRVLVVAWKELSREELMTRGEEIEEARQTVSAERARRVERAYERLEQGLEVLGASAVEDSLQEGVRETLESLRAAGIRIWMLTGDNIDTAINISYSCGHFKAGTERLHLTEATTVEGCSATMMRILEHILDDRFRQYGLVVDGPTLALAMERPALFRDIAFCCYAVICCRMSPLQKSEVVALVKGSPLKPITAAIGDGANDVSMILEAHVGFGLMGREGRQAVRSADYAFARFRYLHKALLVHGHWYYERLATLVLYFFYKNIVFILPQFYFGFYSAWSTEPVYDWIFLMLYNIFFTSLPILVYGLMEQVAPARDLFDFPQYYRSITRNALLLWSTFFTWMGFGLWHSLVVFFVPLLTIYYNNDVLYLNNQPIDNTGFGTIIYHNVIWVVNLKLLIHSQYWTWLFVGSILLSAFGFMLLAIIYSIIKMTNHPMYMVYVHLLESPIFWFISVLTIVLCLMPDISYIVITKYVPEKTHRGKLRPSCYCWDDEPEKAGCLDCHDILILASGEQKEDYPDKVI